MLLTRNRSSRSGLGRPIFNSSEMRLARALLLLANYGNDTSLEPLPIDLNQETLAEMIGCDPVSREFFHEQISKLGLIKYNGRLEVVSSTGQCNTSRSLSAGVLKPKVFRGR